MVTLLAWIAHKLVSSNKPTKYASDASCNAKTAEDWNRKSVLKSWAISLTNLWNGNFLMSNSVDFWYLRISLNATVPGRYLCGFLTPPVAGADLRAALVASCFLGALPPVLFVVSTKVMVFICEHFSFFDRWKRPTTFNALVFVCVYRKITPSKGRDDERVRRIEKKKAKIDDSFVVRAFRDGFPI